MAAAAANEQSRKVAANAHNAIQDPRLFTTAITNFNSNSKDRLAKYASRATTTLNSNQLAARAAGIAKSSAARAARAAPPLAPQPLVPQPPANNHLTLEKALEIQASPNANDAQKQRAQAVIDNHQSSTAASTAASTGGRKRKHRTRKQRKQRTHKRNLRRY